MEIKIDCRQPKTLREIFCLLIYTSIARKERWSGSGASFTVETQDENSFKKDAEKAFKQKKINFKFYGNTISSNFEDDEEIVYTAVDGEIHAEDRKSKKSKRSKHNNS